MNHNARLRAIQSYFEGRVSLKRVEKPSRWRAAERRRISQAQNVIAETLRGGAEQIADDELRNAFLEMNSRLLSRGQHSMPAQFNVFESFLRLDENLGVYRLLPEHDHLFSWSDFIDFVTSRDCSADIASSMNRVREGEIFSYSVYDDPHGLTFATDPSHEFTVGGVSLIRHGDEITVHVVAGQVADLAAETERVADRGELAFSSPFKRGMPVVGERRAETLGVHNDLWKTIAYVRFHATSDDEGVKYALRDNGDHYDVATNDDGVLFSCDAKEKATFLAQLLPFGALFELCKTACLLPEYFAFKYVLIRNEQYAKGPVPIVHSDVPWETDSTVPTEALPAEDRVFKRVSALRLITTSDSVPTIRRFTAPQFRVQVRGFWRETEANAVGHGPNGEAVRGRTWVREHDRWRDRPAQPLTVLVKSRVTIARQIVDDERMTGQLELAPTTPESPERRHVTREEQYRQRKRLSRRLRWRILQRDDFRCQVCGADAATDRKVKLDVDHVMPISAGGLTEPGNLRTLCDACNGGKGELI